jgi:hypothetical protein
MIATKSSGDVERVRHRGSPDVGPQTWVTTYLGPSRARGADDAEPPLGTLFPVAYLIDQEAGKISEPHFHQADQFQVFVAGSGHIGKHAIDGVSVHYAGAFTPYGPIVPGDDGLSYMTMRNSFDPGTKRMPRERELLRSGGRKPRARISPTLSTLADPGPNAAPIVALDPEADGLAAWLYRCAPGAQISGPDPRIGGGQFWLVLAGELDDGAGTLPRMSCVFVSPDEAPFTPTAGTFGCDVLALRFPTLHAHASPRRN